MKKRVCVYYSGAVQGVGFRFTAESLAGRLGICGWAKNLDDGRVEVVAEAEQAAVEDFLARLKQAFSGCIQDIQPEWEPSAGGLKDFRIRF